MSSMGWNRRGRRFSFRPAGAEGLPSPEGLLTSICVAAAFALLIGILLGVIG